MDVHTYLELNLEDFEFLYNAKWSTVMVPHFFVRGMKVEFSTISNCRLTCFQFSNLMMSIYSHK